MQEVYEFLKECNAYFFGTDENGQPRVRPFSTIYFGLSNALETKITTQREY